MSLRFCRRALPEVDHLALRLRAATGLCGPDGALVNPSYIHNAFVAYRRLFAGGLKAACAGACVGQRKRESGSPNATMAIRLRNIGF